MPTSKGHPTSSTSAPEAGIEPGTGLFAALERVYDATKARFCFIMDEWVSMNMFVEYGAVEDSRYDRFFGFTQDEVRELCARHLARTPDARVGYEGLERWYDGYLTGDGGRAGLRRAPDPAQRGHAGRHASR